MGTRRKSRELAMQMLFQGDLGKQTPDEVRKLFWASVADVDADTRGFTEDLYRVATTRQEEIDALIESHAQNWRIERMPVVDRNLIRAAVAEMLGYPNTPAAIIINETLEQALDRAGLKAGNKGFEAAIAAIEMVSIQRKLGANGPGKR